jgi:enoyl-CoA hydratase/carnithine racemase
VDAIDHASRDRSLGVILLTAAGKVFCAGMDLAETADGGDSNQLNALHEQLFTLCAPEKPVVAAIRGQRWRAAPAWWPFHIVVASPDATFGLTEIRIGLALLVFRSVSAALGERRTVEPPRRPPSPPRAREMGLIHEIAEMLRRGLVARRVQPDRDQGELSFVNRCAA